MTGSGENERWWVLQGDSLEVLKGCPDNHIDAMCTDPPSGTGFMNKDWDCFRRRHNPNDIGRDNVFGRTSATAPHSYGESERDNFVAFMTEIMKEAFRTLKPGAHAFVWALPRTSSWTCRALEDAGFDVRHVVHHHYGSGFPKSQSVDKFIDKLAGAKREVIGRGHHGRSAGHGVSGAFGHTVDYFDSKEGLPVTAPATEAAKQWSGWGSALKPSTEHWILVQKPLAEKSIARNVLAWGCGALNIDACRVNRASDDVPGWHQSGAKGSAGYLPELCEECEGLGWGWHHTDNSFAPEGPGEEASEDLWKSWTKGECPRCKGSGFEASRTFAIRDMSPEEIQERCGSKGRFPPDLLLTHSAGCRHVGTRKIASGGSGKFGGRDFADYANPEANTRQVTGNLYRDADYKETVERWECEPDCPVRLIDEQSGTTSTTGRRSNRSREAVVGGTNWLPNNHRSTEYPGDSGGASRFFPTFHYFAKPSRSEREAGCQDLPTAILNRVNPGGLEHEERWAPKAVKNNHPTVKGLSLCRWLAKLITPPNGIILDPFAGSGSIGAAALLEGFQFIGIEQDPAYCEIARARLRYWEVKARIDACGT